MNENGYTECYIAFLDILGFKNRVNDPNVSCEDILKIYDFLIRTIGTPSFDDNMYSAPYRVKMKIMSDSILLYIEKNTTDSLFGIVWVCSYLQGALLELDPPVFVRGAITCGNIYMQKDITFGPGLTEAYLMEEHNAKYPRIIMTREVYKSGKDCLQKYSINEYDSYIAEDDDKFMCVKIMSGEKNFTILLERIKNHIIEILDETTDDSIRSKYLYFERKIDRTIERQVAQQDNR